MDHPDYDDDMEDLSDWIPDRFILSEEGLDQETYEAFLAIVHPTYLYSGLSVGTG